MPCSNISVLHHFWHITIFTQHITLRSPSASTQQSQSQATYTLQSVLYFPQVWVFERFQPHDMTLKATGIFAIQQAAYDFLLVSKCKYFSYLVPLWRYWLTYQNMKRSRDPEHISYGGNLSRISSLKSYGQALELERCFPGVLYYSDDMPAKLLAPSFALLSQVNMHS